ncbi:MAG: hypothetical protein V1897_02805 [Pseudomonadota bacterium]
MKEILFKLMGPKSENHNGFDGSCQKYVTYLLILLPILTFLLVACGGGGGGTTGT